MAHMMGGHPRPRHTPFSDYHQNTHGVNAKTPPGWDPGTNRQYPFETWRQDLIHWMLSTDLPVERQAAAIVLQLGGLAREHCRELTLTQLRTGDLVDIDG